MPRRPLPPHRSRPRRRRRKTNRHGAAPPCASARRWPRAMTRRRRQRHRRPRHPRRNLSLPRSATPKRPTSHARPDGGRAVSPAADRYRAMKSGWADRDAEAIVAEGAKAGIGRDFALRIYTTRLIGRDAKLVLHGGGNTSLKEAMRDRLGV